MGCNRLTIALAHGPELDFTPTGVEHEWRCESYGQYRGTFPTEDVTRMLVEAVLDGPSVEAMLGAL